MKTSTMLLLGGGALVAWYLWRRRGGAVGRPYGQGPRLSATLGDALERVVPGKSRGPLSSLSNPPAPREYVPGFAPAPPAVGRYGGPGAPRGDSGGGKLYSPPAMVTGAKVKAPGGGPMTGPTSLTRPPDKSATDIKPALVYDRPPRGHRTGGPGLPRFMR